MATHSSTLAWKIPWTEEPCRLQSMGSQRVGHDLATPLTHSLTHCISVNPKFLTDPSPHFHFGNHRFVFYKQDLKSSTFEKWKERKRS